MTRQQYDAEFKAQAVERVRRKTKPASRLAEELGVPRKTLYRWLEAGRQHPADRWSAAGGSAPMTSGCGSWNARSAISRRRMPS